MPSLAKMADLLRHCSGTRKQKLTLLLLLVGVVVVVSLLEVAAADSSSDCRCVRGECVNGTCICDHGWQGESCDFCAGRVSLNASSGYISDGPGNYSIDLQCTWLINTSQPNSTIRLKLNHFATECCWDHLYIFDGDSAYAPLIAAYSGLLQPESNHIPAQVPELVTSSGSAYLHFYSDAAYNMSGFNISYSVESCPANCSGNGVCIERDCTCNAGWSGRDCATPICPNNCGKNGSCLREDHVCACDPEYTGDDCSYLKKEGFWESKSTSPPPYGRASHAAIVHNDSMYVFGGERFHKERYCDIWRFDFVSSTWSQPPPSPVGRIPLRRYGHTAVVYLKSVYIFGGVLNDRNVSGELWKYDLDRNIWSLLPSEGAVACVGHTATKAGLQMIVIFGHSPVYGYLNYVQHYDLAGNKWTLVKTKGSQVKGGFGHTSVYDYHTQKIYVHGGYHSESASSYDLDDVLYIYDPNRFQWDEKRRSSFKRYLHSAAILSGLMLVYGGNTHNDTTISHGSKCHSAQFLAYDIVCDEWITLKSPSGYKNNFARYGHSAVVHNTSMYIFGGFNGEMLNDVLKFTAGTCSSSVSNDTCVQNRPGVKCLWDNEAKTCLPTTSTSRTRSYQTCATQQAAEGLLCSAQSTCSSCTQTNSNCVWCNGVCSEKACKPQPRQETRSNGLFSPQARSPQGITDSAGCELNQKMTCGILHSCQLCTRELGCVWNHQSQCVAAQDSRTVNRSVVCQPYCSEYTTCQNCTQGQCLWCSNEQRCVESNAYAPAFPYGQCMDWTTRNTRCPASKCSDINSCDLCLQRVGCGWCDDGSKTGLGACMEGGNSSPVRLNDGVALSDELKCVKEQWNFGICPACDCNGHSSCNQTATKCDQPCLHHTDGEHCEKCSDGFFGKPINGGNCTACECNGHGTHCNPDTGKCFCTTKGITGSSCDKCDESNTYVGNPSNGGTCYYKLTIDYQFTFNLSKPEDNYYTQINFMNTPPKPDMDTDFSISCNVDAYINVTYKTSTKAEQLVFSNQSCKSLKYRFPHTDYSFGTDENTTFYVYVYDFQTPMWIQIAFSQYPKLDLLQFFITFSSCFLSLLVIAAILWKIKQRYDLYRRRQRLFVEMEQMASRPFASVFLQIEPQDINLTSPLDVPNSNNQVAAPSKKKRKDRPSPIALEPCFGNKAAVLSLIVRLPTGDESHTPPGQTGIAIASTLVTLGNPRKPSLDAQKMRKNLQHQHPDTCI